MRAKFLIAATALSSASWIGLAPTPSLALDGKKAPTANNTTPPPPPAGGIRPAAERSVGAAGPVRPMAGGAGGTAGATRLAGGSAGGSAGAHDPDDAGKPAIRGPRLPEALRVRLKERLDARVLADVAEEKRL